MRKRYIQMLKATQYKKPFELTMIIVISFPKKPIVIKCNSREIMFKTEANLKQHMLRVHAQVVTSGNIRVR